MKVWWLDDLDLLVIFSQWSWVNLFASMGDPLASPTLLLSLSLHLLWCVARTWCHVYALFKPFIHVKAHINQQMSFYYLKKRFKDVLVYFIMSRKPVTYWSLTITYPVAYHFSSFLPDGKNSLFWHLEMLSRNWGPKTCLIHWPSRYLPFI